MSASVSGQPEATKLCKRSDQGLDETRARNIMQVMDSIELEER